MSLNDIDRNLARNHAVSNGQTVTRSHLTSSIGDSAISHSRRPSMSAQGRQSSSLSGGSSGHTGSIARSRSSSGGGSSSGTRSREGIKTNTVKAISSIAACEETPLAAGGGVSLAISLAEPVLYLQGIEHASNAERDSSTTLLRGTFHLRVSKAAKIKAITLSFRGRAETDWPEGIPPRKTEYKDRQSIINHTWTFFNAQFPTAEHGSGADTVQPLKGPRTTTTELGVTEVNNRSPRKANFGNRVAIRDGLSLRDQKRLSLSLSEARSFGLDEPFRGAGGGISSSVACKGYRVFQPGVYSYNFELPIDSRLPESIHVDLGQVRYDLEAVVERAGAFRANLVGSKPVTLIRVPAEGSLEQVEPIAISRNWEDQLHYEIVISGKSFALGSQVPIAFKLTPLAKVQCHRVKVYMTENIQYFTGNRRVHRLEPTRKLLLFEKRADAHSMSTYPGSEMRILSGGGVAYDSRTAAASGCENVSRDMNNLLGDLGAGASIGPTEMEINVQLPRCHEMLNHDLGQRLHFDTTYKGIQIHHWIKVVLRLSRSDAIDPKKRRHFEIAIDSPLHILSCLATQANTALPAYTSPESATIFLEHPACGCPDAPQRPSSQSAYVPGIPSSRPQNPANESLSNSPGSSARQRQIVADSSEIRNRPSTQSHLPPPSSLARTQSANLTRLPAAHISRAQNSSARNPAQSGPTSSNAQSSIRPTRPRISPPSMPRPMHLLRNPSFNPPPFNADEAPPPLPTPPPNYSATVPDPSNGLADYFARLANAVEDHEEHLDAHSPRSRMDLPLTPGGRINRSMDERRTWLPLAPTHREHLV